LYFNAQGITNKFDELSFEMFDDEGMRYDIIMVTETWLTKNHLNSLFHRNSELQVYRSDRVGGIHGGAAIILSNNILVSHVRSFSHYSLIESVWLTIHFSGKKIRLAAVYRSPLCSDVADLIFVEELKREIENFSGDVVVCGDFNLPRLANLSHANFSVTDTLYWQTFAELNLDQKIDVPTRLDNVLDLLLTTDDNLITNVSVNVPFSTSDHNSVTFNTNVCNNRIRSNKRNLCYAKGDYLQMNYFLSSISWNSLFMDVDFDTNYMWEIFVHFTTYAMDTFIPRFKSKVRQLSVYSSSTRKLYNIKRRKWNKYKVCKSLENRNIFRSAAAAARKAASLDVRISEEKVLNSGNLKQFYNYVNSKLTSRSVIPPLKKTGSVDLLFDDESKASAFQEQFCSVFTLDDGIIPPFPPRTDARIADLLITEYSVVKAINSFANKTSCGVDKIPSVVLKKIAQSVSYPLSQIFIRSFEMSEIPHQWLVATITPAYKKKGDNSIPVNYRPISLIPVCAKVMESLVRDSMLSFMRYNDLLSTAQHGFMKNKSTLTNVLSTTNEWRKARQSKNDIHVCYIDFAKAFDSISHVKLLHKLYGYGICGKFLRWIESYLSNRTQITRVNDVSSVSNAVTSGVPQGTVLGPLLFAIFVNDLPENVLTSSVRLYADDSKIFRAVSDVRDTYDFQLDLERVYSWSVMWQLPIAAQKCSVMVVGSSVHVPDLSYKMGSFNLPVSDSAVDLGFTISNNLKTSLHCVNVTKKALNTAAHIFRCFKTRDVDFLLKMYEIYVRPIVESSSPVWSPYLKKDIDLVEKVQRRFTKRVPGMSDLSYEQRLTSLNMYSLMHRRIIADLVLTFNIIRNSSSLRFDDFFAYASQTHSRSHHLRLQLPKNMTNICQSFFANRMPRLWNNLPHDVVTSINVKQFKDRLRFVDLDRLMRGQGVR
jgi:hypothetical protein